MPELERSEIKDFFTEIIGEVHIKCGVIEEITKRYDLDPDQTYYVGDTSGDVEEGKKAGIKTVAVAWGYQDRATLEKQAQPDILVNTIPELKKYF